MEWVEEHDFAFDELDIDAETKELSIYRFFNNIMENLTEDDILNAQINLESKKRKKYGGNRYKNFKFITTSIYGISKK